MIYEEIQYNRQDSACNRNENNRLKRIILILLKNIKLKNSFFLISELINNFFD